MHHSALPPECPRLGVTVLASVSQHLGYVEGCSLSPKSLLIDFPYVKACEGSGIYMLGLNSTAPHAYRTVVSHFPHCTVHSRQKQKPLALKKSGPMTLTEVDLTVCSAKLIGYVVVSTEVPNCPALSLRNLPSWRPRLRRQSAVLRPRQWRPPLPQNCAAGVGQTRFRPSRVTVDQSCCSWKQLSTITPSMPDFQFMIK